MPLPEPRHGEPGRIPLYPNTSDELTLGDPEKVICSSIKQFCVLDVAEGVLFETHGIRNRRSQKAAAMNVKLYIQQALEFYEVAKYAKPNTAPLFYYYCFLHLAKARCEMFLPIFHRKDESYRHGISWRPNRKYIVDMENDFVSLTNRGIWHVLWEAVTCRSSQALNSLPLRIKELFSICPEISIEYSRTYGGESKLIELARPELLIDSNAGETWIRFSVYRSELRIYKISKPKLLRFVSQPGSTYRQVKSNDPDTWTFELERPKGFGKEVIAQRVLQDEIRALNVFAYLTPTELEYNIPIQTRLPLFLPQIMVLYTLVFWLGSLVRYDPHSVAELQDSPYWILIDGFMNQSRIWLLELFEWEFYQAQTTLRSAR